MLALRRCKAGPPPPPRTASEIRLPPPPPPRPPAEPARPVAPGRAAERPERLEPFLARLGRARLLRDRVSLKRLLAEIPPVYESDVAWIGARLAGELFGAAGAAEILRLFGLRQALPELAETLGHPVHPFLKEVVIGTLASFGGDAAAVALLAALRADRDGGVRARAAAALGGFPGAEAFHGLVAALRDPDLSVRSAAAQALAAARMAEAAEALLRALEAEGEPAVQADLIAGAWAAGGEPWRETVIAAILPRTGAAGEFDRRSRIRSEARYRRSYDRAFFEAGGTSVPYDSSKRRIGITVEAGPGMALQEIAAAIFGAAPLDRYRGWFHLRRAEDFPAARAWDASGAPLGDVPWGELDGTVFLRFRDAETFDKGVLGVTRGCEALVTGVSLLHELGHAFARLGDEYAEGSNEDAANLAREAAAPWMALVAGGHLEAPRRRDAAFFVPSGHCHMGNDPAQRRYCPVCQLEFIARLSDLTGAPLPW
jgi:hypothetical protein